MLLLFAVIWYVINHLVTICVLTSWNGASQRHVLQLQYLSLFVYVVAY